jgi:putative transcriptional regulator
MRIDTAPRMTPNQVRNIRKAMGFSQEEFARFLWITYSTLNRWEAGRAAPFGMHLRILELLQNQLTTPSFRAALESPRAVDPTFLLYRLLKPVYGKAPRPYIRRRSLSPGDVPTDTSRKLRRAR